MSKAKVNKAVIKTCFVIMPISNVDGYDDGHFSRVYDHLIKPACEKSGYTSVRADEVASSNYIVIDILTRIVDSDIVVCDLSGRNPNVLYELGIRQAFNLPTILIKDNKTDKIFDIQGIRTTEYSHALRIDSVEKQISSISDSINETVKANDKDINSLIQLLGVKSATLPSQIELSSETSVVLSAIKDLSKRIISLEQSGMITNPLNKYKDKRSNNYSIKHLKSNDYEINSFSTSIGDSLYIDGNFLDELTDVNPDGINVKNKSGELMPISVNSPNFYEISTIPF